MKLGCGLVLFLAFAATNAHADDKTSARAHYEAASKAYDVGDYDEAIREFTAAYKLHDDPTLLYNLAQAHRLAGHRTEALRVFRNYLIKVPKAPNRQEVERHIAELSDPATATPVDPAQAAYQRGQAHLDANEIDAAVTELEKAHALKSTPPIELALGHAYERANRPNDALVAYRRYVAFSPAPSNVSEAQARIAALETPIAPTQPLVANGADLSTSTAPPVEHKRKWVVPVIVVGAVVVVGLAVGLGVGLGAHAANPSAAHMVTIQ